MGSRVENERRLIDTAGSELAIVPYAVPRVREGETGPPARWPWRDVLEVYEEEHGQEGGVQATLVVESTPKG